MKSTKLVCVVTLGLYALHASLFYASVQVNPVPAVLSWAAYHTYFSVAQALQDFGIPAIAPFEAGMFIAPVTAIGKVSIAAFWFAAHFVLALIAVLTVNRYRSKEGRKA